MKRKLLALLLALVMLACAFPTALHAEGALAASGKLNDKISWTFDNNTRALTITGTGAMPNYTSSGSKSPFFRCNEIKSVTIGEGITSVGNYLFYQCVLLGKADLPTTLETIGAEAFAGNTSLKTVNLPAKVNTIGQYAFSYSGLTNLTIPKNVTTIGMCAFARCKSLAWILTVGNNTKYATDKFGALFELTDGVPAKLLQYPVGRGDVAYVIPDTVTEIGRQAFASDETLEAVLIPDSVTSIGAYAFEECTALAVVGLGSGVKTIGSYAFNKCSGLKDVYVAGGEAWHETAGSGISDTGNDPLRDSNPINDCEFGPCGDAMIYFFDGVDGTLSILGQGAMEDYDFDMDPSPFGYLNVKKAIIGNDIHQISDWAFFDCDQLSEFQVEAGDASYVVLNRALYNAAKTRLLAFPNASVALTLRIPEGVTEIAPGAAAKAKKLMQVFIPASMKTVGYGAFEYCEGLKEVYYASNKANFGKIDIEDANDPLLNAKRWCTITNLPLKIEAPVIGKTPQTEYVMNKTEARLAEFKDGAEMQWSPNHAVFKAGTAYTVTVLVFPRDGYRLPENAADIKVTVNGKPAGYTYKLLPVGYQNYPYAEITYTFDPLSAQEESYVITTENCTPDRANAKAGETVIITAAPAPAGKVFAGWKIEYGDVQLADPAASETTFVMPAEDVSITALYKDASAQPAFKKGDVDGNGKIETKDARLALRQSIGLEHYAADSSEYKACDVDGKGGVTTMDARFILRKSIGLTDAGIWD